VFGIYPGGAAGSVGATGPPKPEDAVKRLAALEQLRPPGRPFVLHLYAGYSSAEGWSAEQQVGQEIGQYTAAGFQIELVLAYRPSSGGSPADVTGFANFVRAAVHALGPNPDMVSLQVTNEANVAGAPNASDGYYAGAQDALIQGVIAANAEARADGITQLQIGFNWANQTGPSETKFWSYLGRHGGKAFTDALDWVGLDAYPGTWGPPSDLSDLAAGTAAALDTAFAALRTRYLPLAGIPASVPLHVSENGFPTGPRRSDAMQMMAMQAAIGAVERARARYNITAYRWFDLRDADSAGESFETHYGLLSDAYSPKPAFELFRSLVAKLSVPH
jgi:hypothetical protein